jgi:TonB-linked SusC/RagA family outer membrane protein
MRNQFKPILGSSKMSLVLFAFFITSNAVAESNKLILIKETAVNANYFQNEKTITGNVYDDQGPLTDVIVKVDGLADRSSITDVNGNFTIKAPEDGKLIVTYLGYVNQLVNINKQSSLKIKLEIESKSLNEIVVVGYGTQKKVNLTGAVSSVDGDELITRQSPNTTSLLQGRMPGVQVTQNSGQPGAENTNIQIRGQGTFSAAGNNPLILIDGVEGTLNTINPNMIESVSVLKDASSASIYGSRAAGGVILITTKNGKAGRINVDYTLNLSSQKATSMYDRVTNSVKFMEMINSAIDHTGISTNQKYTQQEIDLYKNGDPNLYPSFNWMDAVFKTAPMQQHFLSVNGGKEGTTYNFGLGYLDQDGILISTSHKRYDAHFNFKSDLGKRVTFGTNINFSKANSHNYDVAISENQVLSALAASPTFKPLLPDGSGRYSSKAFAKEGGNINPVAFAENANRDLESYYTLASANLSVDILPGLVGEVKGGVKFNSLQTYNHAYGIPSYLYVADGNGIHGSQASWNGAVGTNNLTINNERDVQYTLYGTLKYSKKIAEHHNFDVLGGVSQENFNFNRLQGFKRDAPTSNLTEFAAYSPTGQTVTGYSWEWALQSVFGRVNYNFKEKYLVEANFRYDGSSRFNKDNRWGFFPSASLGWRISQEDFLKNNRVVNDLKARFSWGQLGNQNINRLVSGEQQPYPYQPVLNASNYYIDGVLQQGLRMTELNNPNIKWETTTIANLGLDFALLNSRIFGSVDAYTKTTTDILRELQVPGFIGLAGPTVNQGEMKNTGLEFLLGHQNKINDFGYSVSLNFETYKNELVKFGPRNISNVQLREEGLPYNTYFMYIFDGIYQNAAELANSPRTPNWTPKVGDMKYRDISGPNGVPDGIINEHDRTVVDGAFPNFNYGINLSADYKRFDISLFLQGVQGRKIYLSEWGIAPFRQASPPPTFWLNSWNGEGSTNSIPHIFNENYAPNTQNSTFWLQDASYLRLKNLQIGYTFAESALKKVGLAKARIYVSGDNLLTFTKFFDGIDPERSAARGRAAIYPQAKLYSFGLRASF